MESVRQNNKLKKLQEKFPSKVQKKAEKEPEKEAPKWDAKPGELQF